MAESYYTVLGSRAVIPRVARACNDHMLIWLTDLQASGDGERDEIRGRTREVAGRWPLNTRPRNWQRKTSRGHLR